MWQEIAKKWFPFFEELRHTEVMRFIVFGPLFLSLIGTACLAQEVFVSRGDFLRAVAGHELVKEDFSQPISNAPFIIFESGPLAAFRAPSAGRFENRVRKGRFESGVDYTAELAPDVLTITFPEPILGFGADWFFALTGDGLSFDLGGYGGGAPLDQAYDLEAFLSGNGTGFWGVVSPQPFRRVTIRGTRAIKGTSEQFSLDDLVFVLAREEGA
ncbi:MAG: hypothetical protein AAGD04_10175 [Pseudomonadota bacterium]